MLDDWPSIWTWPGRIWPLARDEIRRDQLGFWLPPEFPAGTYAVQIQVLVENRQVVDTLDITPVEVKR